MTTELEVRPSYTLRVDTPDGTMWCTIIETNGEPNEIHAQIGKSGSSIRAWTSALASLATEAIRHGISLNTIAASISEITTDKVKRHGDGISIRSGPEGIVYCILRYIEHKKKEREGGRPPKWLGRGTPFEIE